MTRKRRIAILLICSMSLLIVGLDVTAVNVALPAIGADLDADLAWLQWAVSAYTLVMASLLLVSGSIADRLGRRRTLSLGITVFALASLLCSLAPTVEVLVAARVLQGVGASMMNPVAMSIVTATFTDRRERAQAVGVWGAMFGVAMAAGPIAGGALTDLFGWRAIFLINVPLGLLAIALLHALVPESRAAVARRLDPVGQLAVVALLAGLTFGIIEAPEAGWTAPAIVGAFALAVAALAGLLVYEPRRAEPLIDLHVFRSIPFSASIALSVTAFATFGGFLFLNTLYLQDERGLSAVQAGVAILPVALMIVLLSPVSGRIVGRSGPRVPLLAAGLAFTVGCALLVGLDRGTPLAEVLGAYVLFGVGFGFVNAPITTAAVSGLPVERAGVAAAIATTSRQFGQALGVAVAGAVAHASEQAAWWTLTGLGVLVLVLGAVATSARAERTARRVGFAPT